MISRTTSNPESAPAAPATAATATATVTTPASKRRGRPKGSVNGTGTGIRVATKRVDSASPQAKSTAAVILEGLTGLRSAPDAARALGITVARYYTVEAQAVAGLLAACEPGSPGPVPNAVTERELTRLRQEHRRQDQELARLRAVLRTTQRSLGLPMVASTPPVPPGAAKGAEPKPSGVAKGKSTEGKRRRARRPVVRALTVLRRLQAAQEAPQTPAAAPATSTVSTTPEPERTSSIVPVGG